MARRRRRSRGSDRPRGGRPPKRWDSPPKTGGVGKGTKHKSSSTARGPVAGIVFAVSAIAVLFVGSPIAYLVYEYAVR